MTRTARTTAHAAGPDTGEPEETSLVTVDAVDIDAPEPPPAGTSAKDVRRVDRVIIRFAGDSGDGMQLTGDRFTSET
ncbi:2-oxoglutarate ferredoxin oxidoreductase subunit alpha, partial [Streptomyces acidicola]